MRWTSFTAVTALLTFATAVYFGLDFVVALATVVAGVVGVVLLLRPPDSSVPAAKDLRRDSGWLLAAAVVVLASIALRLTTQTPGEARPAPVVPPVVPTPSGSSEPELVIEPELISATPQRRPGDAASGRPSLSDDGRYVAFTSAASNLAPGDTNARHDIFWVDRLTGERRLVSRGVSGQGGNAQSQFPAICPSGNAVAFASQATDLVDIPLARDRWRVYVWQRTAGHLRLISPATGDADGDTLAPVMTAACDQIAFMSDATNWTTDAVGGVGVFVYDLASKTARAVGRDLVGTVSPEDGHPSIDATGRRVAFAATVEGGQRIEVLLWDEDSARTTRLSRAVGSVSGYWPALSRDGERVSYLARTDGDPELVVWSVRDGAPAARWADVCLEVVTNGIRYAPGIASTPQGPILMYQAIYEGHCRLIVRRVADTGTITTVYAAGAAVTEPTISADGSTVAWAETAPGDRGAMGFTLQVYACARPRLTADRPTCSGR
ncbi:MAG TPA: hypothetical protein VNQ77_15070 [Frankiaceae bacterium]|nr:hypothetical protein [Frankiaceae bacterium]